MAPRTKLSGGRSAAARSMRAEKLRSSIGRGHARVSAAVGPLRVYLEVVRLQSQTALAEEPTPAGVDEETAALYDEARQHLDAFSDALRRAEERRALAA